MKIVLGDLNEILQREDISKPKTGNSNYMRVIMIMVLE
jgi:hypothetical protein